jgi:hypothetical protein
MGCEVAAQRVQLGVERLVEHVAHHGHARRPLRHSAEIGVAKLRHPAASTTKSLEHDSDRRTTPSASSPSVRRDRFRLLRFLWFLVRRFDGGKGAFRRMSMPPPLTPLRRTIDDVWYVIMARLERASLLRWPRRIMVSMVSLRNRLAAAASSSSPVRSRYSHAIWKDSSSSWEGETDIVGKRIRPTRVPSRHGSGACSRRPSRRLHVS